LIDATGISQHHDNRLTIKSKLTSQSGVFSGDYGKDGATLGLAKCKLYGGLIGATIPKMETFNVNYCRTWDYGANGSIASTASVGVPFKSFFDVDSIIPRLNLKYSYGKGFNVQLSSNLGKASDVAGEVSFNQRFAIARGYKGLVKGEVKQSMLMKSGEFQSPSLFLNAKLLERNKREYGMMYNSKKSKISIYNTINFPDNLKMPWILNALVPTAVGVKAEMPANQFSDFKTWQRFGYLSYALGKRGRDTNNALNLAISSKDVAATILRKDTIMKDSMTVVYSLSGKVDISDLQNGAKKSPSWGFRMDIVGDVNELSLSDNFGLMPETSS